MTDSENKKESVDCRSFLYIIGLKKSSHTFALKQFREPKTKCKNVKEHASRRKVLTSLKHCRLNNA
jgi:hypothetical protein